jgi:hypothetical protein
VQPRTVAVARSIFTKGPKKTEVVFTATSAYNLFFYLASGFTYCRSVGTRPMLSNQSQQSAIATTGLLSPKIYIPLEALVLLATSLCNSTADTSARSTSRAALSIKSCSRSLTGRVSSADFLKNGAKPGCRHWNLLAV